MTEIFDAHCDTMSVLVDTDKALYKNNLHIDAERMGKYSAYTQVFAAFVSPKYSENPTKRTLDIIDKFLVETRENGITVCKNYSDWKTAKTPIKAFLSIEGGDGIKTLFDLERFYSMGVRMIAPTWNFKNHIACGVGEIEDTGLTPFGKALVREMNRLGIVIDVSHLGPKSFRDVCSITEKPVCASHSNLISVQNHPRNLTDEQFKEICRMGGVVGMNFSPPFFGDDVSCVIWHTERMLALGGENNIGFGSDFDGVDFLPRGINGAENMGDILSMLPCSESIKEKIAYKNFLRLIEHNC